MRAIVTCCYNLQNALQAKINQIRQAHTYASKTRAIISVGLPLSGIGIVFPKWGKVKNLMEMSGFRKLHMKQFLFVFKTASHFSVTRGWLAGWGTSPFPVLCYSAESARPGKVTTRVEFSIDAQTKQTRMGKQPPARMGT